MRFEDSSPELYELQAYLDGELKGEKLVAFESHLKRDSKTADSFSKEKAFLTFLEKSCATVKTPEGFSERLKSRLDAAPVLAEGESTLPAFLLDPHAAEGKLEVEEASAPVKLSVVEKEVKIHDAANAKYEFRRPHFFRSLVGKATVAASIMLLCGVGFYYYKMYAGVCPYLVNCIQNGEVAMRKEIKEPQTDIVKLTSYVQDQLKQPVPPVPDLKTIQFTPEGAGLQSFNYGPPDAAYVRYQCTETKEKLTLMLHPSENLSPRSTEKFVEEDGHTWWRADHEGYRVVCWKTLDGKMLCSIVSSRDMEKTMTVAREARQSMDLRPLRF